MISTLVDDLVVGVNDGLIQGDVDGHRYVFNPRGYHGVMLLPKEAYQVLVCCLKAFSISDIKTALPWARTHPWKLIDLLNLLGGRGILNLGREFSEHCEAQQRQLRKQGMTVWLQMTDACNLRCSYCYISKKPTHMNPETAQALMLKIAKECRQAGYDSLLFKFAGGEPTTRWRTVKELVDWADAGLKNMPFKTTFLIVTNGTSFPLDLIDYAASGKLKLSISLDGTRQWHDKHRVYQDGQGSFCDVDRNIELLLRRGIRAAVSCTITKDNVNGLTEFAQYCVERDLTFRFSPYRQPFASRESLKSENKTLIEELGRCYGWLENHLPARSLYEVHRFADVDLRRPRMQLCGIGSNAIAITSDGQVCLCPFDLDNPIGNGLKSNIVQILKSQDRYLPKENRVDLIPVCQDCKWRFTCAAGCPQYRKEQYGTFRHASPYCEVYRAILPILVRLHAVQLLRPGSATIPIYPSMKEGVQSIDAGAGMGSE
jgi:uncharacterized protein